MSLPIYMTSTVQRAPLGNELVVLTDRVYRYAKNGSAGLAAGTVVQAVRPNTSHDNLTCAAAAIGDTSLSVTLGTAPVDTDEYRQGYVFINDQAGEGFMYDVRSHLWAAAGGSLKLELKTPVEVALTTSSQATLVKSIYDGVNRPFGDPWDIICGVVPTSVAADEYFWCQVRGPAAVLQEGGLFAGRGVMLSQAKPGAFTTARQVVPVPKGIPFERRIDDTEVTGHIPTEGAQFQQKGIEQRFDYESGRQEPDEILTEVAGKATIPERILGYCINPRVSEEYALVYLTIS